MAAKLIANNPQMLAAMRSPQTVAGGASSTSSPQRRRPQQPGQSPAMAALIAGRPLPTFSKSTLGAG